MARQPKSTTLYPHPFSKAYWQDAAAEMKDTKMLVITALMIALRVALKPAAIQLGPQLSIQTAMLATALGAMIYGPVMAIPAAMISDTIGFMLFPNGEYFLPFMLTEIASSMIYALFLYRAKVTPTRVMLSRFFICFLVNVVLQQFIIAWQYTYMGNPEEAKDTVLGIMSVTRVLKNLGMFPLEAIVMTLFLKYVMPIVYRAKLIAFPADLRFDKKQIITLVVLVALGAAWCGGYLVYHYDNTSVTTGYSKEEVPKMNKKLHGIVTERTAEIQKEKTVAVIEFAKKPFLGNDIQYTVAIYQVKEGCELTEDMWSLKKTPASKHPDLERIATATVFTDRSTVDVFTYDIVFNK